MSYLRNNVHLLVKPLVDNPMTVTIDKVKKIQSISKYVECELYTSS